MASDPCSPAQFGRHSGLPLPLHTTGPLLLLHSSSHSRTSGSRASLPAALMKDVACPAQSPMHVIESLWPTSIEAPGGAVYQKAPDRQDWLFVMYNSTVPESLQRNAACPIPARGPTPAESFRCHLCRRAAADGDAARGGALPGGVLRPVPRAAGHLAGRPRLLAAAASPRGAPVILCMLGCWTSTR